MHDGTSGVNGVTAREKDSYRKEREKSDIQTV